MASSLLRVMFVCASAVALSGCWAHTHYRHGPPPPASVSVHYIRKAPPPPRRVYVPPRPIPRAIWVGGYWRWTGADFFWVDGYWERNPPASRAWAPGRWIHTTNGWYWEPGRWR